MGPEAETVFNTFKFNAIADKTNFDIVVKLYDDYFAPRKNVIHERAMFYFRNQKQGEAAELFIRTLYEMAEKCEFGDQKEDHIRDRIVTGLSDNELSRELQLNSDLNLNTAVQLVKERETVKSQLMAQGQSQASALEEVRHPVGRMNTRKPQSNHDHRYRKCNYKHEGRPCPAKGKQCRMCRKLNHFASCWKT